MSLTTRIAQAQGILIVNPELPEHLQTVATCDRSDHWHHSLLEARRCTYEHDRVSPWVRDALNHELRAH